MKTKNYYMLAASIVLLMTGCGSDSAEPDENDNEKGNGFRTNQSSFITKIDKDSPTRIQRNAYIDEFIAKSNVQCQYYLASPLREPSEKEGNSHLYMSIFDAVSQSFGMKPLTDVAKELYSGDDDGSKKTKTAYENALTPEIIRGVKISRKNYAQKMTVRKNSLIESYTIPLVKQDMRNYDKLCSHETGLIEINKALRKAQKQPKITPFSPTLNIDPTVIKNKVEAVTKEEETKQDTQSESHNSNKS